MRLDRDDIGIVFKSKSKCKSKSKGKGKGKGKGMQSSSVAISIEKLGRKIHRPSCCYSGQRCPHAADSLG